MEKEEKEYKPVKKYQRREFIKTTAKAGIGIGLGGFFGNLIGKGYRTTRDSYRENVKPYVEKGKKIIDKTDEAKDKVKEKENDIKDWYNKNFNKQEYERQKQEEELKREAERKTLKEPEKTSRRSFLSRYLPAFNEHPVGVGTATGAGIGAILTGLKLFPKYINKKKIAKLRDQNIDYNKRLKILEEYKERLEEESAKKDGRIAGLEKELTKIYEKLDLIEKDKKESKLEDRLKDSSFETPISLIISGAILMITLLIYEGIRFSGFFILSGAVTSIKPLSIIVLVLSLFFALIGLIKLRKIRI